MGMGRIARIVIPGRPPGLNQTNAMRLRDRIKAKKFWRQQAILCATLAMSQGLRFAKEERYAGEWGKRKLVITGFRKRALDFENFAGACKPLVDGLKIGNEREGFGSGVIVDDNDEWCDREYWQLKSEGSPERIEIEVWE